MAKPITNPKIPIEDIDELYAAWEEAQKRGVWGDESNLRLHRAIIQITAHPNLKRLPAGWRALGFKEFRQIFVSDQAYDFILRIMKEQGMITDQGQWNPELKTHPFPSLL